MKLSFVLLHTCLSFLAVASQRPPDIMARSSDIITYTVTPVDRANTYETESLLKDTYGESNVVTERHNGIFMSWKVTSPDTQLAGALEALKGVQNVVSDHEPDNGTQHTLQARDGSAPITPAPELVRRDAVWYSCLANNTDTQKTEDFLKSKVKPGTEIFRLGWGDKIRGWYHLHLDDDAKKEVEAYEGVRYMRDNSKKVEEFRAVSKEDRLQPLPRGHKTSHVAEDSEPLQNVHGLTRRATTWEKQQGADQALVMDSQYTGADLGKLSDYVYRSESGEGTFIYVIDRGVRTAYVNPENALEFHPPDNNPSNIKIYQTEMSVLAGQKKDEDDSSNHIHGTGVAAKAVGTLYGVAKKATLISVKNTDDKSDFLHALDLVMEDVTTIQGRAAKSVVVFTGGWGETHIDEYEDLKADGALQATYGDYIREILKTGVPIVCAAGNYGSWQGRQDIDTLPALFQDEDTPLINVGAADFTGRRWVGSQGGSQLTIYGPGVDITIPENKDRLSTTDTGTSLATPQVAGLIATYLSYDKKPWDDSKTGIDRVKAIRDYLTSDASSWERQPGIRMIWNGAKKEDHDSAGANASKPPPSTAPKDPTPSSPPPPQKSQALGIVFGTRSNKYSFPAAAPIRSNRWLFFSAKRGSPSTCYKQIDAVKTVELKEADKALVYEPGWPVGTYGFRIDGMDCEYKNDGKGNPGALWCKGRSGAIECFEEEKRTVKEGVVECEKGGDEVLRRSVAYCEW